MNTIIKLLVGAALFCLTVQPAISATESTPCKGASVLDIDNKSLTVEMAADVHSRTYGLRFRESMGENCGMLFVFQNHHPRTFTMQNTLFALDIAFVSEDGTIAEVTTMQPGAGLYTSMVDAAYVLEVHAGWLAKNRLSVGNQIKFKSGETLQPMSTIITR